MSNNVIQNARVPGDRIRVSFALIALVLGFVGFYFFSDHASAVRVAILLLGIGIAVAVGWASTLGQSWVGFVRESVRETKKVVWPKRKEAMQITGIVFAFVVVMAIFLWGTDKFLEFLLYDLILGWKK
jgi:preprotein translocase subunit SecE